MSAYDITEFCVLRTDPLRTAYRLKPIEYCVPKKGGSPSNMLYMICLLLIRSTGS